MDNEEKKAYNKVYYEANKEVLLARNKGYREANKEEIATQRKAYYEANKKEIATQRKAYYEANKKEMKAYYEANKEKILARNTAYRRAHMEERCAMQAKRRALKKQAMLPTTDNELMKRLYEQRAVMTEKYGEQYQVDHIIPLTIGGAHHQDNMRVITAKENMEKKDKYIPELGGAWADNKLARKNRKKYEAL